jgi:hypothetical protein
MPPEEQEDTDFYTFKGKITLELELDSDADGMTPKSKVTVTGMTKEQLYWLFEGGDLAEDLGNYVYEHMAEMAD